MAGARRCTVDRRVHHKSRVPDEKGAVNMIGALRVQSGPCMFQRSKIRERKKLLVTSASLLGTSALLVVTRSH